MSRRDQPLVDLLIGASGTLKSRIILGVAGLVALLPMVAAWVPNRAGSAAVQGVWRLALAPSIIVFILLIHPLLLRCRRGAIEALRPLARQPGIVDQGYGVSRVGEGVAMGVGALLAAWITQASWVGSPWLYAYLLATTAAMFSLTALSIFDGLHRTAHLRRIVASGLTVDLFDRQVLTPVARFGQAVSLTFLGGVCLSLVFQSYESLYSVQSLVIYSILTSASLTLFLTSIWSVHSALVAAQACELAQVRQHWRQARREHLRRLAQADANASGEWSARVYEPLLVLSAYERQLLEASTWPFNPKIVKELAASAAAPVLIYAVKVAAGLAGAG